MWRFSDVSVCCLVVIRGSTLLNSPRQCFSVKIVGLNCGVRGNSKIMINRLISGVTRNFKKGEGHKLQKPSNESGIFQSLDNICSFSLTGKSKGRLHVTMPSLNTLLCLIQTSGGNTYPTCIPSCIPSTAED